MFQQLKYHEGGYLFIELVVALTLISLIIMGSVSFMASLYTRFGTMHSKTMSHSVAQSILDDMNMRFLSGQDISTLTIDDWHDFLSVHDLNISDVDLKMTDMTGLSDYRIDVIDTEQRQMTIMGGSDALIKGSPFLIEGTMIVCEIGSIIDNIVNQVISYGISCDMNPLLDIENKRLLFPHKRVVLTIKKGDEVDVIMSRYFYTNW